jgi:DNA invertase Pin-like site-specific DNA recombinase
MGKITERFALFWLERMAFGDHLGSGEVDVSGQPLWGDWMKDGTDRTTRAALYARVSTSGHGQDVGLQVEELRQVAVQRGWIVCGEYVDQGVSGSKTSRPALDRMLADARQGELDLIVCWKLDRLGRSLQHLLQILETLTAQGVGFFSLRDSGIDTTTAQGRLLIQLLGAFAEFEKSMIQERVQAGVDRARRRGVKLGRPEREVDIPRARQMIAEGRTQRQVSVALKIPRSTLRRALSRV